MIQAAAKIVESPKTGARFVQTDLQMNGKAGDLIAEASALLADIAAGAAWRAGLSEETHDELSALMLGDILEDARGRIAASAAYIRKTNAEADGERAD